MEVKTKNAIIKTGAVIIISIILAYVTNMLVESGDMPEHVARLVHPAIAVVATIGIATFFIEK